MGRTSAAARLATAVAQQRPRWIRGRGRLLLGLDLLAWLASFAATARFRRALNGSQTSVVGFVGFAVVVVAATGPPRDPVAVTSAR